MIRYAIMAILCMITFWAISFYVTEHKLYEKSQKLNEILWKTIVQKCPCADLPPPPTVLEDE